MSRAVAAIQADLTAAYAARRAILDGAQSYQLDTGQSRQTVTRADLPKINATIVALERELEEAQDPGGGIISVTFRRYG